MRLYLDICALNRPYDDQNIDRNRLEAEAVLMIIGRVAHGQHSMITSEIIDREIAACPDIEKADLVLETLRLAQQGVVMTPGGLERFRVLAALGFRKLDAMHLACAEVAECDYLITTDDKLEHISVW